ncbi:MAG TPA: cupredoxin domain-containing protein [Trichormus sp.]|jgi:cytochrome c oxidase subunit 2
MKSQKARAVVLAVAICVPGIFCAPSRCADDANVINITAKKYNFTPSVITLKKDVPAVLHFTSLDRKHGFNVPGLNVRTDIPKGKVTELKVTPKQAGTFPFYCDVFCGDGHDNMTGKIVVVDK